MLQGFAIDVEHTALPHLTTCASLSPVSSGNSVPKTEKTL